MKCSFMKLLYALGFLLGFGIVRDTAADAAEKYFGWQGIAALLATEGKKYREASLNQVVTLLKNGTAKHRLALNLRSGDPDIDRHRQDAQTCFRDAVSKAITAFHLFKGDAANQVKCIKLELFAHVLFYFQDVTQLQVDAEECVHRLFQVKEVQLLVKLTHSTSGNDGIRALLPFAYLALTEDVLAHLGDSSQPCYLTWLKRNMAEFAETVSDGASDLLGETSTPSLTDYLRYQIRTALDYVTTKWNKVQWN